MTDRHPVTLVVGAGGLLGRACVGRFPGEVVPARVRWGTVHTMPDLDAAIEQTMALAARDGFGWQVCWAAGAGVTGTTTEQLSLEVETFGAFLDSLHRAASDRGTILLASSAGGVYAGSPRPPYDEDSPPLPTSAYGEAKLRGEQRLLEFGAGSGQRIIITRIANLYGPGQNLAKPQGLISHLCRSQLTGAPLSLYVPMDTVRDYLYVTDAAAMVDELFRIVRRNEASTTLKVLASGRPVTIGALLAECGRVFRRRPRVVLAVSPLAKYQASDLRLRSRRLTQVDHHATTTLGAGIHETFEDLRARVSRYGARSG